MFKIFLLAASLIAVAATPFNNKKTSLRNEDLSERYRLTDNTIPTFYDVRLIIIPEAHVGFAGSLTIRIVPHVDTNEIVLHALNITAANMNVYSDIDPTTNLYQSHTLAEDDTEFLRISLTQNMTAFMAYNVEMDYVGQYSDSMFGLYFSSYETETGTRRIVTSQLQPTFARRVFPCYDEPKFKAIFRTTIYTTADGSTVLSNMPERTDAGTWPEIPEYVKHEFEDTLPMSTYLLAYLVSDFDSIDNTEESIYRIPFNIYSRPGTQDTAMFALEFGQKNMLALENYTNFPYEFPKMDKVAVPDLAFSAMENWGLVIYREVALLVRDGVTTTATKQNIGRIICHENMHQWFGNEVSPESWTYTWLNEGFANLFESYATDFVLQEWRMMDQFVLNMQNVFQSDAVLTVNPMTHPVYTPSEIIGTFNAVAYQKSGSVIRMLEHFLTPEVFQRGLVIYIRDNHRRAVTPAELYSALQQAVNERSYPLPASVEQILTAWTTQGGFPVVTVRRSAPTANSVVIAQERYLTDPTLRSPDRWRVPVNWVLSTDVDFSDTSPQAWVPHTTPALSVDIPTLNETEWFIFNKQQTGYYRVNYDISNWQALVNVLNSDQYDTIHVLNRAQLIDDAFNLARTGRLDYRIPLELARYLVREADYIPWAAANAAFTYLETVLSGTPAYELLQSYLLELSLPLFDDLGFEVREEDEHVTAFHRNIILDINCRHGNENCTERAQNLLQEPESLHPDIQTSVYCSGLRGGDAEAFNTLWNMFLNTADSSLQSILLNALGCTSNTERLEFYMNQVISEPSAVREQDRHTVLVSIINSGPDNSEVALDFIVENFLEIQPRVQGISGSTNILNALSRTLNTEEHERKINEFEERYQNSLTAGELASVAAIKENIGASLFWTQRNFDVVNDWLRNNYGNSAVKVTMTAALIVPFVLSIYNSV